MKRTIQSVCVLFSLSLLGGGEDAFAQKTAVHRLVVDVEITTGTPASCEETGVGAASYSASLRAEEMLPVHIDPDQISIADVFSHVKLEANGSVRWAMCEARCPDGGCGGSCEWKASAGKAEIRIEQDGDASDLRLVHPVESREGRCELRHDPNELEEGLRVKLPTREPASRLSSPRTFDIVDEYGQGRVGKIRITLSRK